MPLFTRCSRLTLTLLIAWLYMVPLSTFAQTPGAITLAPDPGNIFGYIPLTAFGGNTVLTLGDDGFADLPVPSFVYSGQTYSTLGITANGFLVVGGASAADAAAVNQNLPDSAAPNNVLAPFWTDLNPANGGAILVNVLTDGVGSWIVVEWDSVPEATDPSRLNTFQIWIGINGVQDIQFAYRFDELGSGTGGLLTVGAENANGTSGQATYYNGTGALPSSDLRVSYTPDATGPSITLTAPTEGAQYTLNQAVNAAYSCADEGGVATCTGTVGSGSPIDTSSVGSKTFSVTATDNAGNTTTVSVSYTVIATAPSVSIFGASNVTPSEVTLTGLVNANGADTSSIVFELGTAPGSYTQSIPATPSQATGTSDTLVEASEADLAPNTTYYARLVATNSGGTTASNEVSFRTAVRVTDYALFTTGAMTLSSNGGAVSGRIAALGDIVSSRFALGLAVTLPADTVTTNGNLSLASQTVRGNAVYGGTLSRPNTVSFLGGAPIQRPNALESANTSSYVASVSSAWAELPANGTSTFRFGVLRLNGTNAAQNVFTVTSSDLANARSVQISAPSGSTVIVNVSGTSALIRNAGLSLSGVNAGQVVFNFWQATSLALSSTSVPGTLWSPNASVVLSNGSLSGSVVAQSLSVSSASVSYSAFTGVLPR